MSAGIVPEPVSLSFRRVVDVPFETCVDALDSWLRTGQGSEPRPAGSQLLGPVEHDPDTGTRRFRVRLARGPLRPLLRMRLDVDRWSATSTALELIPCGRVRPTVAYFRSGHLLLDWLTCSLPRRPASAQARDMASQPHVPVGSGRPLSRRSPRWQHTAGLPWVVHRRPALARPPRRPGDSGPVLLIGGGVAVCLA